ncbi:YycH family regulatory protein [Paenibacillus sp. SGZ-1009]|uniref:YycH family regulatory protein n=1 Tax=Paenibacillus campi TaxID=3106031 RepID=UPI002AFE10B0|nr:two-component system activity regulator YycH [Paenibacillus sp. SGZ-1009]
MKEKLKSGMLAALIVVSLIQSYFLIYRMPGANSVVNSEAGYVQAEDIGPRSSIENLIFPDKMIVHMGGNRHTLFYPSSSEYTSIYNQVRKSSFGQFRRLSVQSMDWNQIRNDQGIELLFSSGIPVSLLERSMRINPDSLFEGDAVNRIWLYTAPDDRTTRAFFFSASGDVVYEATDMELKADDISRSVQLGTNGISYQYTAAGYYLPRTTIAAATVTLKLDSLTTEQMQRNLFFDPGATRNINEENGTEIYTDSKRSLQVDTRQRWMIYTDPTAPTSGTNNVSDNVLSAVDFVNQHGGWPGTYTLSMGTGNSDKNGFVFRQYYGSYPIIETDQFKFGYIRLAVERNTVSTYERSMLYLASNQTVQKSSNKAASANGNEDTGIHSIVQIRQLPAGQQLLQMIKLQIPASKQIVDLSPVYRPSLGNGVIVLTPVWMAKLQDGSTQFLTVNE